MHFPNSSQNVESLYVALCCDINLFCPWPVALLSITQKALISLFSGDINALTISWIELRVMKGKRTYRIYSFAVKTDRQALGEVKNIGGSSFIYAMTDSGLSCGQETIDFLVRMCICL